MGTVSGRRHLRARALYLLERALLAVGLVCVVSYAVACAHDSWVESATLSRFERRVERALLADSADQSEWSESRRASFALQLEARTVERDAMEALGRLEIPTGAVSVAVLEGTKERVLDRAAGRIEGTATPGEAGNMGIAGHRDGHFRGLRDVEIGDPLYFASVEGIAEYEVVQLAVVEPDQIEVLDPTPQPSITLVTCYPFVFLGKAPQRFIVRAERVALHAWKADEPVDAQLVALRSLRHSS